MKQVRGYVFDYLSIDASWFVKFKLSLCRLFESLY